MVNTHKINVGVDPNSGEPLYLAVWPSPEEKEVTKVSQVSNVEHFWESENFQSFPNGTEIELLEEGLGYNCYWSHVKIGETEGYVYSGFIIVLKDDKNKNSWEEVPFDCEEVEIGFLQSQDWTKKSIGEPYYEEATRKWCVSVESINDPNAALTITEKMENEISAGLELILSANGKEHSQNYLNKIINNVTPKIAKAEEYFIPPNSIENMKVLITFPRKYLVGLMDIKEYEEYKEAWNTLVLHADYHTKLLGAASRMQTIALLMDKFDGTVENIDLRKEASRIDEVRTQIKTLLVANNVEVVSTVQIELGLNADGACTYIAENSRGAYRKLTIGTHNIANETPFDSPRTMNFLSKINEIFAIDLNPDGYSITTANWDTRVKTWTEFLNKYVDFPKATIIPSKPKGTSALDITDNSKAWDPHPGQVAQLDKLKGIYQSLGFSSDPCNKGYGFDYWNEDSKKKLEEDLEKLGHRAKKTLYKPALVAYGGVTGGDETLEEVKEDWNKSSVVADAWEKTKKEYEEGKERAKKEITDAAEKQFDNIKDSILGDLKPLMDELTKAKSGEDKLDTIYKDLLHKICIWDLSIPALACLIPPDASGSMDQFKDMMDNFPVAMCKQPGSIGKACVPTIGLPSELPTEDLIAVIAKIIWDAIISMLVKILVDMAKRIIELFLSMCNPDPENEAAQEANQDILGLLKLDNLPEGLDINKLLDDLALLLNPGELCKLFKGKPTKETVDLVYNLVKTNHPALLDKFKTKTFIIDFFSALGGAIDSKMCDDLAELPEDAFIPCRDPYEPDPNMEKSLSARGVSSDIIEDQLEKARERKKEKIDLLSSIIEMMNSATKGEANPFQDMVPLGFTGSLIPLGTANLSAESVSYMQDLVLNTMFSSVYSTFNREADRYTEYYITKVQEVVEVPLWLDRDNKVVHPDVLPMLTAGMTIEQFEKYEEQSGGPVPTTYTVKKVNTYLKHLLAEIETNEVFEHGVDNEGFYYALTLPPDPQLARVIEQLRPPDSATGEKEKKLSSSISKLLSSSNWVIRYKLPFVKEDEVIIEESDKLVVDSYILEVYPKTDIDLSDSDKREEYLAQNLDIIRRETTINADADLRTFIIDKFELDTTEVANLRSIYEVDLKDYKDTWMPADEDAATEKLCLTDSAAPQKAYLPLPNIYFGEYIGGRWDADIERVKTEINSSATLPTTATVYGRKIKEHFAKKVHTEIAQDMFSLIAKQISKSLLFENRTSISEQLKVKKTKYFPVIGNLNLNRTQTPCEKVNNIDPHLLKINKYKEDLISFVNKNNCLAEDLLTMNTDGTARSELNSWESAVTVTIIELYVRATLLDYVMRGVFVLTQFNVKSNDYIVDYLLNKMISELDKYGGSFVNDFQKYSSIIYTKMIGTGDILPETITNRRSEGLRAIIKKTLISVYEDLTCVVYKDLDIDIDSSESALPKKRLIEEWMPLLDAPSYEGEPRFSVKGISLTEVVGGKTDPNNASATVDLTIKDYLNDYLIEYPRLKKDVIDTQATIDKLYIELITAQNELESLREIFHDLVEEYWLDWEHDSDADTVIDNLPTISGQWSHFGPWYMEHYTYDQLVGDGNEYKNTSIGQAFWRAPKLWKIPGTSNYWKPGWEQNSNLGVFNPEIFHDAGSPGNVPRQSIRLELDSINDPDYWSWWNVEMQMVMTACTVTRLKAKKACKERTEEWINEVEPCGDTINAICAHPQGCIEEAPANEPLRQLYPFKKAGDILLDCLEGNHPFDSLWWSHGNQAYTKAWATWPIDAALNKEEENKYYQIRKRKLIGNFTGGQTCDADETYCKPRKDAYKVWHNKKIEIERLERQFGVAQYNAERARTALDTFGLPSDTKYSDYVEFMENDAGQIIRVLEKIDPLNSVTVFGKEYTFDLSNGNFFLERYWKVKRKSAAEIKIALDKYIPYNIAYGSGTNSGGGGRTFSDWTYADWFEKSFATTTEEIADEFDSLWKTHMMGVADATAQENIPEDLITKTTHYGLDGFKENFGTFYTAFQAYLSTSLSNTTNGGLEQRIHSSIGSGDFDYMHFVLPQPFFGLDNFFDKLEPTLRLVYLPPTRDKHFGKDFIPEENDLTSRSGIAFQLNEHFIEQGGDSSNKDVFEHLGEYEHSYYVKEEIDRQEFKIEAGAGQGEFGAAKKATRILNIIPLLDTSTDEITAQCEGTAAPEFETWWKELETKTEARFTNLKTFMGEGAYNAQGVKIKMTNPKYVVEFATNPDNILNSDILSAPIFKSYVTSRKTGKSYWSANPSYVRYPISGYRRTLNPFDFDKIFGQTELQNLKDKLVSDRNMNSKLLFDYIFPVDRHLSMLHIFCMMASSTLPGIEDAFTGTKDRLWRLTEALMNKGDYHNSGPTNEGLLEMVLDIPPKPHKTKCCYELNGMTKTWSEVLNSKWEWTGQKPKNPFADLGFDYISKALLETGETIYKQVTEITDPNIRTATLIRDGLKAVGMCDPPPLWSISLALLPPMFFGFPPFGFGNLAMMLYPWSIPYWFMFDDNCVKEININPERECATDADCKDFGVGADAKYPWVCDTNSSVCVPDCTGDNNPYDCIPASASAGGTAVSDGWSGWGETPKAQKQLDNSIVEEKAVETEETVGTEEIEETSPHPAPVCIGGDIQYDTCETDVHKYQKQKCQSTDYTYNGEVFNIRNWVNEGSCVAASDIAISHKIAENALLYSNTYIDIKDPWPDAGTQRIRCDYRRFSLIDAHGTKEIFEYSFNVDIYDGTTFGEITREDGESNPPEPHHPRYNYRSIGIKNATLISDLGDPCTSNSDCASGSCYPDIVPDLSRDPKPNEPWLQGQQKLSTTSFTCLLPSGSPGCTADADCESGACHQYGSWGNYCGSRPEWPQTRSATTAPPYPRVSEIARRTVSCINAISVSNGGGFYIKAEIDEARDPSNPDRIYLTQLIPGESGDTNSPTDESSNCGDGVDRTPFNLASQHSVPLLQFTGGQRTKKQ